MLFPKCRQTRIVLQSSILFLSFALISCGPDTTEQFFQSFGQSVKVAPGDSSPPTVTLIIPALVGRGQTVLHSGDTSIKIHMKDIKGQFFIIASAEDPQGVQSVCFQINSGNQCDCDGTGESSSPLESASCYANNVSPGSFATTKLWIQYLIDPDTVFSCKKEGCTGVGEVSAWAYATNFSGQQSATAAVTFVNP